MYENVKKLKLKKKKKKMNRKGQAIVYTFYHFVPKND